jgi:hypothetical protein
MPLIYLRDNCHKQAVTHIRGYRQFESMYTLQRKTRPTCHTPSMLSSCMVQDHTYLTRSMHSNPSWDTDSVGQSHCSWEKGLPTHFTACWLTNPRVHTQFLSRASQWSSGESQTSVDGRLLGLPGAYHRHTIGIFNTCSRGPTHRSLTDIGKGYNLEGTSFSHTHSPTFPTSYLQFPLRAPPSLHFNQVLLTKPKFEFKEPMAATWSFDHSVIYHSLHLRLAIANDLSLVMGSTRIDWKVIVTQLCINSTPIT